MPRVLRILNRLNLGGPSYNVAYLTRDLAPEFETVVAAGLPEPEEADSGFILRELGIDPVRIPAMRRSLHPIRDLVALGELRELIRRFRPHIVHTHASKAGGLGRIAAGLEGVPVVVHTFHGHVFHSHFGPAKTRIFLAAERALARRSTAVIALSASQKRDLSEVYRVCPPEKVQIVPLGFDLSRFSENQDEKRRAFRALHELDDDTFTVGLIGRLAPIKNHELFLRALARLRQISTVPVRGFIIGDGERRGVIENEARALKLGPRDLVFTSWIEAVEEPLAGLDAVALTSRNEGTPVCLIEAGAAGRPVVATNVGGVGDVVEDGASGILCSQNPEAIAGALGRLAADPALRITLGDRGREIVRGRYSRHRLAQDMRQFYRRLLEATHPRGSA